MHVTLSATRQAEKSSGPATAILTTWYVGGKHLLVCVIGYTEKVEWQWCNRVNRGGRVAMV